MFAQSQAWRWMFALACDFGGRLIYFRQDKCFQREHSYAATAKSTKIFGYYPVSAIQL
jgi:hypothetical protein